MQFFFLMDFHRNHWDELSSNPRGTKYEVTPELIHLNSQFDDLEFLIFQAEIYYIVILLNPRKKIDERATIKIEDGREAPWN